VTGAGPLRQGPDGLILTIRLQPRATRPGLDGVAQLADGTWVLKARVGAPPEDGKANAALITLLAKLLGLAPSRLTLISGAHDRVKRLAITGLDAAAAAVRLNLTGV